MGGHICTGIFWLSWLLILGAKDNKGLQQVITNPRIVEHPEDQYVTRNEPAALTCKAEGEPQPLVTWYHNNQRVITTNEDPVSHRMLLPNGQLFFMRVIHNRHTKPDVGVYYCNATNPETHVSVISKTAILDIASIGYEFLQKPKNTAAVIGGDVELECKPPKGEPEPQIFWKKDGKTLKLSEKISVNDSGNLRIGYVNQEDAGLYVCVAYNIGGERESTPVKLSIREKPRIVSEEKEIVANLNSTVTLRCFSTGDPLPSIFWKKSSGVLPTERSLILGGGSLKIERVQMSDEGRYVCRAENSVGWEEADTRLTVHTLPSFLVKPLDRSVGIGKKVSFKCEVTGNPRPAIFWNKQTTQMLMMPSQDHGRFSVSDDGTLVIESVQKEDAGEYTCKALSVSGIAYAKAILEVKDSLIHPPPPVIRYVPQNQTLPINSEALLQCSSALGDEPQPVIRWYKNGRILSLRDPRLFLLESGGLQISDLRKTDTGIYSCKLVSDAGETTRSAALVVENTLNPLIVFHRTPEPSALPGPPSRPVASEITDRSIRLIWKKSAEHGASSVLSFCLEYFSQDITDDWMVVSDSIHGDAFNVVNLQPDTFYVFLVRAQNSRGMGPPSLISPPYKTKGVRSKPYGQVGDVFDPKLIAERLSGQVISLFQPEAVNSTAIKLTWEVQRSHRFIDGIIIKYRATVEPDFSHLSASRHRLPDFSTFSLHNNSVTCYTLINLLKCTIYEIRLQPYHSGIKGQESNTVKMKTFDDVPSSPPRNIIATLIDNSTLHLQWKQPQAPTCNGQLLGYKIYIHSVNMLVNKELLLNSTLTDVYIHHLLQNVTYRLRMSTFNHMGESIKSDSVWIGAQPIMANVPAMNFIVSEPWFVVTLTAATGCFMWLAFCLFATWAYKKHKSKKKLDNKETLSKDTFCKEYNSASKFFQSTNRIDLGPEQNVTASANSNHQMDMASAADKTWKLEQELPVHSVHETPQLTESPSVVQRNSHSHYVNGAIAVERRNTGAECRHQSAFCPVQSNGCANKKTSGTRIAFAADDCPPSSCRIIEKSPILFLPPPPDHPPPSPGDSEPDDARCQNTSSHPPLYDSVPAEFPSEMRQSVFWKDSCHFIKRESRRPLPTVHAGKMTEERRLEAAQNYVNISSPFDYRRCYQDSN